MKFSFWLITLLMTLYSQAQIDTSYEIDNTEETSIILINLKNGQKLEGEPRDITETKIVLIHSGKKKTIQIRDILNMEYHGIKMVNFGDEFYKIEIEGEFLNLYTKSFVFEDKGIKSTFDKWLMSSQYLQNSYQQAQVETLMSSSTSSLAFFLQKGNSKGLYQVGSVQMLKNCYLITDCPSVWNRVQGSEADLDIFSVVTEYNSCF